MNAVVFARVSSKEQADEGFSLQAQERLLLDYCKKNKLEVIKVFSIAESAKTSENRKRFQEMIAFVKESGAGHVVVEKNDRLTRNFKDIVTFEELMEDYRINVHFVKENEVINKDSTSQQKFIFGIRALMSKNYIDNLSEETKKGMMERARAGWIPGKAPYGYQMNRETREVDLVPEQGEVVTTIFKKYIGGKSMPQIADWLECEAIAAPNGKNWHKSAVQRILRNRFYTGQFEYVGEIFDGKHSPVITFDLWQAVQEKIGRNKSGHNRKHSFPFSKMMVRPSDGHYWVGEAKKGIVYYGVRNRNEGTAVYINQADLLTRLGNLFLQIQWPMELVKKLKEALKELNSNEEEDYSKARKAYSAAITKARHRKKRLFDAYLDELITKEEYGQKLVEIDNQITKYETHIDAIGATDKRFFKDMNRIADLLHQLPALFESGTAEEKAKLLDVVISHIEMENDREPVPVFKPVFKFWLDNRDEVEVRTGSDMLPLCNRVRSIWMEAA